MNSSAAEELSRELTDSENEPKSIDNGDMDELLFVGDDEMLSMMNEAGAGGDYTSYNLMNFGNYLWGATGYVVGLNYDILQGGAHLNSILNPEKNGYVRQWDSKDDQRSIKLGIFHAYTNKYRRYRK